MNVKKFLSIFLSVLVIISFCFSGCKINKVNSHLDFVGFSYLPEELILSNPVTIGNQIYFLEHITENIFNVSISNYTTERRDTERREYDLCLLGSYFPETILKYPVSMCSDDDNNLFVLEAGNDIDKQIGYIPKLRLVPSNSNYQYPVHIRAIYANGEIKAISNLHLRLKELEDVKEARKIRYLSDYLIVMFEDLNSLLFIKKDSFETNTLSYFMIELPQKPIDFDTGKETFVVLLEDSTLLRYEYNSKNDNFTIKTKCKLDNRINNGGLIFLENENIIIIYNIGKEKIHIIKNDQQDTMKIKGLLNIFKLKVNDSERIVAIRKENRIENNIIYEIR